jgi:hypothetical protein
MTILSWVLKIFSILPFIANGVHTVQADLSATGLHSKLAAAQDALSFASGASISLLPAEDQALATSIATMASQTLASTVTTLHNAAQPAS